MALQQGHKFLPGNEAGPQGSQMGSVHLTVDEPETPPLQETGQIGRRHLGGVCPVGKHGVWQRLATDLKPRHLLALTREVGFDELPGVFDSFIQSRSRGRLVVKIGEV